MGGNMTTPLLRGETLRHALLSMTFVAAACSNSSAPNLDALAGTGGSTPTPTDGSLDVPVSQDDSSTATGGVSGVGGSMRTDAAGSGGAAPIGSGGRQATGGAAGTGAGGRSMPDAGIDRGVDVSGVVSTGGTVLGGAAGATIL